MKSVYTAIRVLIKAVRSGRIQFIDANGLGADYTNKELFQQYGFASRPKDGAEGILLKLGGADNAVVIATEDRRYRVSLENGEVALYSDEGDRIHLKRGKELDITSGNKITINAAQDVNITGANKVIVNAVNEVDITGTGKVAINSGAEVSVTAPSVVLGAQGGTGLILERFLALFNAHTHSGVVAGPGVTGSPAAQAGPENKTNIVKAA